MNITQLFCGLVVVACSAISISAVAGGNHGHHGQEAAHDEHEQKGPNGGKLLEQGHFALEVTIYENGVPPEMRVYAYEDGQLISPANIELSVTLKRMDSTDSLSFSVEGDYLLGDISIYEPHSYKVEVSGQYEGKSFNWHYDNFEGRTTINDRLLSLSGIETETAQPQLINEKQTLFGVIEVPTPQKFTVITPYISIVEAVFVQLGDQVKKGQPLLKVKNVNSLQSYIVKSPGKGEVTFHDVSIGNRTAYDPIMKITDLSQVWVNLSAFPENVERMKTGQTVSVYDLHHHEKQQGKIIYVAPAMTGGHIARARALIDNREGHWRPGMHVKSDIIINTLASKVAVKKSAIQRFRDFTVVFAKFGNTFEIRPIQLGQSDDEYVEVLAGLNPNTEYATTNSYVIKADILKSGASHDH